MAERSQYHVLPDNGDWKIKKAGNKQATRSGIESKEDAIDMAKDIARDNRPSQLVVHKRNGNIQQTHHSTYEEDPRNIPG